MEMETKPFMVMMMAVMIGAIAIQLVSDIGPEAPGEPEEPEGPLLPSAVIELSDLSIEPGEVYVGDEVVIRVLAKNTGATAGYYEVSVTVPWSTRKLVVNLDSDESKIISTAFVVPIDGTHNVTVDGLSGSFLAGYPPAEAELVLSDFGVTWTGAQIDKIEVGDAVHIWAKAKNTGSTPASFDITWKINGIVQTVTEEFLAKQIKVIAYTYLTVDRAGVYNVEIDGLTGSFMVYEKEVITPVATITGMTIGDLDKHQGDWFTIDFHIQSNFNGLAWIVGAYGQGEPTPGTTPGAQYNMFADFLGFFPAPFTIKGTAEIQILPHVGGFTLKKGDNVVSVAMDIPRNYPIGTYYAYAAVMPPAANWYSWPEPYHWKTVGPFEILEELPQIEVNLFSYNELQGIGGSISAAVEVSPFEGNNHVCAWNPWNYAEHPPGGCLILSRSGCLHSPGQIISIDADVFWLAPTVTWEVRKLHFGVYLRGYPPGTIYGTPAKLYPLSISGELTYPDSHKETNSYTDQIPRVSEGDWRWGAYFKLFSFGIAAVATGNYTFKIRVESDGYLVVDKTVVVAIS